jgi:hypothetical protein
VQPLERTVALSRFYELLRMVHGKRDFDELATAIAAHANTGGAVQEEISRSINNSGGRGGFDDEKEKTLKEKLTKTLRPNIAKAIAGFAFPDEADASLRDQCVAFLSDEKKYHRSQSAALEKAWTKRRSASGTPSDNDGTPGGGL